MWIQVAELSRVRVKVRVRVRVRVAFPAAMGLLANRSITQRNSHEGVRVSVRAAVRARFRVRVQENGKGFRISRSRKSILEA